MTGGETGKIDDGGDINGTKLMSAPPPDNENLSAGAEGVGSYAAWNVLLPRAIVRKHQAATRRRAMKKMTPAANPDAYVDALDGWRRACVEEMRAAVRGASALQEVVKWGHLVYLANGPVLLIRAEEERVLLGFWRGQRLRHVEPRLKPGGKYEMATLELREGAAIDAGTVRRLTTEAVALNAVHGNPTLDARRH